VGRKCCLIYFIYFVLWSGVKWSSGNCIIDQLFNFLCPHLPVREELYLSDIHLQAFLHLRFLPGQRLRLEQLSIYSFLKCSKQTWHWLSLGKFALLIHTSHSLRTGLFLKVLMAVDENLSLFYNLWAFCLHTHDHIAFGDVVFLKFALLVHSAVMLWAQALNVASKMADIQIVPVLRFFLLQSG